MMAAISISELLDYTKKILKSDYIMRKVFVKGEIAEFTLATSGHMYFTLKDDRAHMACMMFREDLEASDVDIRVGLEVEVKGMVDIYAPSGKLQLVAKEILLTGEGALYKLFLKLKDLLEREGLFDMERKMPLPKKPLVVGLVTSTSGAAQHDFLEVASKRNPAVSVVISPTRVQGKEAGKEIAEAFDKLDQRDDIDVIVITRGGGSMEDLFCFNDEALIRRLSKRRHPVVSAVGHEVDTTLVDYIADVRAATPTHAAELVLISRNEILEKAKGELQGMHHTLVRELSEAIYKKDRLFYRLRHTISIDSIAQKRLKMRGLKAAMDYELDKSMARRRELNQRLFERLLGVSLNLSLERSRAALKQGEKQMRRSLEASLKKHRLELEGFRRRLKTIGTSKSRARVYVKNKPLESIKTIEIGEILSIHLIDGTVEAKVSHIKGDRDEL